MIFEILSFTCERPVGTDTWKKIGTSDCSPLSHYIPLRGTEVSAQAESTYDQSSPVLTEVTHVSKNFMVSLLWLLA